jgi:Cytochrome c554 and c-prime
MFIYLRNIRKRHYVILVLFTTIYLFNAMCTSRTDDAGPGIRNVYGQVYSGSAVCQTCHREIFQHFIQTAHYRDSRPASGKTILGSFDSGRNRFTFDKGSQVVMERKDSGFFETAYRDGQQYRTAPIDIVIGSGRKGQTYLCWNDEKLFQLPISYFTPLDCWCNSPGYTIDSPTFNRRVPAQCLECHATNARTVFRNNSEYGDAFDKSQIMYGIDCEKCHGPGARHVDFHTANPGETTGRYIVNTGRLTRQQKLDACALCHSGSRIPLKPAFSFRAGDTLNLFSQAKYNPANGSALDVHGNQYGLLSSSKCFMQSQMDCGSCHNVHINEAGNVKLFSQRCMNCHNQTTHDTCMVRAHAGGGGTGGARAGLVLADNCIDCHMPALPSQRIILALSSVGTTGKSVNNLVRTHHIAIYK